jgi:septum formation protein
MLKEEFYLLKQLILASSSPRRQGLLEQVNIPFTIRKPDLDESQIKTIDPFEKVRELAIRKAQNVHIENDDEGRPLAQYRDLEPSFR